MANPQRRTQNPGTNNEIGGYHFLNKLREIPMVQSGTNVASNLYTCVKGYNAMTQKSFQIAETVTGTVMSGVTPLALIGMSMVAPSLERMDSYATSGLMQLENRIPVINTPPELMILDATKKVTETCVATKQRVSQASEMVLSSKPVQTYFDMLQYILYTAENTLDKVLPASESNQPEEEELMRRAAAETLNPPEINPAERGWVLFGKFVSLVGTTKNRVQDRTYDRINGTVSLAQNTMTRTRDTLNYAQQALRRN